MLRHLRIKPNARPLRPPNQSASRITRPTRCIHQTSSSILFMTHRLRPQIPYLSPIMSSGPWQVVRPITTEKIRLLRKTAWDISMAFALVAVVLPSTLAIMWWMAHEMMERDYPTPHEWSFRSRCYWHTVKALADRSVTRGRIPDWSVIAQALQSLLKRLEDTTIDGDGLRMSVILNTHNQPPAHIEFDLSTVYDISSMPEPWRRGYFQSLLEAARTAEAAERMVYDTTTRGLHMLEFVVGPSNPDPVPLPPVAKIAAPLEQNCIRYYPSAEAFYTKLLATVGFTDRQRIEILMSYGEWLDIKAEHGRAEDQFRAAVATAASNLRQPASIFDEKTAIIKHNAPYVTFNLMNAITALAVHLARNKRQNEALPIFLSTIQAYRSCTSQQIEPQRESTTYSGVIPSEVLMSGLRARLLGLFSAVDYPPAPTSGNEPLQRTGDESCKTGAAMIYAAEVLFATSRSQRDTALSWIKQVLHKASQRVSDTSVPMDDREQCNQCVTVALETWWSMSQQLRAEDSLAVNNHQQIPPVLLDQINLPRWRKEELDHWEWAKTIDRAQWEEKLMFEQWKMWSWFPDFTLRALI